MILTDLHLDHPGGLIEFPTPPHRAPRHPIRREPPARIDDSMVRSGAYNPDDIDRGHGRVEITGDHDRSGDGTVTCLLTDGHTAGHHSVPGPERS